ncbi:GFA family protein [Croceicoccus mobilis]|uniref:Aldehyde-activating protein n=1 Tax=Croceicoccus mobilis TaxID=1703339 RepID=A0A916YVC4_9SPHN|nr:GFA family protein [Croceicoccus mobilis]GGD63749.1 aldehyde-activating protein [Croceicoccus mobilis]
MSAPYKGGCACGAVSLTITAEPVGTRQCWCRQCQKISGGGPSNNAMFPADAVKVAGTLGHSTWQAASGNALTFHFCPSCGVQIFAQSSARMHLKTVRLGALDPGHGLAPEVIIWTEDAPEWAIIDPARESWPQQPPPPPSAG